MTKFTFLGPGVEWRFDASKPPVHMNHEVELSAEQERLAHLAGISLTTVPADTVQDQQRAAEADLTNHPDNLERNTGASEPGHEVEPDPPPTPAEETAQNKESGKKSGAAK